MGREQGGPDLPNDDGQNSRGLAAQTGDGSITRGSGGRVLPAAQKCSAETARAQWGNRECWNQVRVVLDTRSASHSLRGYRLAVLGNDPEMPYTSGGGSFCEA